MDDTFNSSDGRPVIAADTAETIGEVRGFVVDTTASRIESVHVSGRGKNAEVVPWSSIRSFGADAVIADVAASAEQVSTDHETQAVKGRVVVRKTRVLNSNGFEQGTVEDVSFDAVTGELTGVTTTEGPIEGKALRALGSYALIVDAS